MPKYIATITETGASYQRTVFRKSEDYDSMSIFWDVCQWHALQPNVTVTVAIAA